MTISGFGLSSKSPYNSSIKKIHTLADLPSNDSSKSLKECTEIVKNSTEKLKECFEVINRMSTSEESSKKPMIDAKLQERISAQQATLNKIKVDFANSKKQINEVCLQSKEAIEQNIIASEKANQILLNTDNRSYINWKICCVFTVVAALFWIFEIKNLLTKLNDFFLFINRILKR
jgi:hypothetical protein